MWWATNGWHDTVKRKTRAKWPRRTLLMHKPSYWAKTYPKDVNSTDWPMSRAGMKVFSAFTSGVTSLQGLRLKFLQCSYRHIFNISHRHLKNFLVFIIKSFYDSRILLHAAKLQRGFGSRASTSVVQMRWYFPRGAIYQLCYRPWLGHPDFIK